MKMVVHAQEVTSNLERHLEEERKISDEIAEDKTQIAEKDFKIKDLSEKVRRLEEEMENSQSQEIIPLSDCVMSSFQSVE